MWTSVAMLLCIVSTAPLHGLPNALLEDGMRQEVKENDLGQREDYYDDAIVPDLESVERSDPDYDPEAQDCEVEFFENGLWDGIKHTYYWEDNNMRLIRDNDMSSLRLKLGCCVLLYKGRNRSGDKKKVCSSVSMSELSGWNDKVSSLSFERERCYAEFFELGNYNGAKFGFSDTANGESFRKRIPRNDDMSSLKVGHGCCVILYKDINYGGDSRKVCSDMKQSQLGEEWNNKVSSLKFTRAPECKVDFFDGQNTRGEKHTYYGNAKSLRRNDKMRSMVVSPACCVTLFADKNYQGRSRKECAKNGRSLQYNSFNPNWDKKVSSMKLELNNAW
jgi:hypothetical protein